MKRIRIQEGDEWTELVVIVGVAAVSEQVVEQERASRHFNITIVVRNHTVCEVSQDRLSNEIALVL